MANDDSSGEDEDLSTSESVPKEVRTSSSPYHKLKKAINDQRRTNKKKGDGRNAGGAAQASREREEQVEQPTEKKDKPVLISISTLKSVGKKAAKLFVHNHTVFPNDGSFALRAEKDSFSSLLYNQFHDDNACKTGKAFPVLLASRRSVWYTCCNQVRGDLISNTKKVYFRKSSITTHVSLTITDTLSTIESPFC